MTLVNQAGWERIARLVLGVVLLYLGWGRVVTGGLGTFLKYFGIVPVVTAIVGWCPLYTVLGVRTNKAA